MPPPDDDFEKAWAGGGADDFDSAWEAAPAKGPQAAPSVDEGQVADHEMDALLKRAGQSPDLVPIRQDRYRVREGHEREQTPQEFNAAKRRLAEGAAAKVFGAAPKNRAELRRLNDALDEEEAFAYFREPIGGDGSGVKDNPFRGKPGDARAFVADRTRSRAAARLPLGLEAIRRASAALTLGGTEALIPKEDRALMAEAEDANPRTGWEKAALFGATAVGAVPPWTAISRGLGLATGVRTAGGMSALAPVGGAIQAGVQTAVEGGSAEDVVGSSVVGGLTAGAMEMLPVGLRALKAGKRTEPGVGKMRLEPEAPPAPVAAAPDPVPAPVSAVDPPPGAAAPVAEGVGKMRLEPQPKTPSERTLQAGEGKSISQFVRASGGIDYRTEAQSGGLTGELDRLRSKEAKTRGLVRTDGKGTTLDRLHRRAVEEGYLAEDSTLSDFVEALEMDATGRQRVLSGKVGDSGARREMSAGDAAYAAEADRLIGESGFRDAKAFDASDPTSIKNRVTNHERLERGIGPLAEPLKRKWGTALDDAFNTLKENPNRPHELVAELSTRPRPHTDTEAALLDIHRTDLRHARALADADGIAAAKRGDLDGVVEAQARAEQANASFLALEDATKRSGTETARGLAFRRAEMKEDYSLLAMTAARMRENGYKPLNPQQAAEVNALHKQLAKAISERDAYAAKLAARPASPGSRQKPPAPSSPEYGAKNRLVSRDAYEATLKSMRSKLGSTRLSAGIDPTLVADAVKIGAFHIEAGARQFGAWAKAMVDDLGDDVKPHLRSIWAESMRRVPEDAVPTTKQAVALEANVSQAQRAWNESLVKDRLANRPVARKVSGFVSDVILSVPRALQTAGDVSAVLRQAGVRFFSHPIKSVRDLPEMFRSMFSEGATARAEAAMKIDPAFNRAAGHGVEFTEHGTPLRLGMVEEAYRSRLAEKIPIIGKLVVKPSQRAFTTFLNRSRLEAYKALEATLTSNGAATRAEGAGIANFVNVALGRGSVGKFAPAMDAFAHVLYSPRNLISRFQFLLGQPLVKASGRTRALVAKEYGRYLAGLATVYGVADLSGAAEVEWNPRSSDFLKIRIGKTRLDPMSGLAQVATFVGRMVSGETKNLDDGKVRPVRFDDISRFGRSKLAPTIGAAIDVRTGSNVIGEKVTKGSAAAQLVTPLSVDEIAKAMEEHGVAKGAAMGFLSLFGMGLQTHTRKKASPAAAR